jgi:hypothetical protein
MQNFFLSERYIIKSQLELEVNEQLFLLIQNLLIIYEIGVFKAPKRNAPWPHSKMTYFMGGFESLP